MIAAARKPQAVRLLSLGAATSRLAWRLGEGAAIAALSYLLVITVLEVTAIAARMQ